MPVQKVPNEWGDMKNLMPEDFGTSDIPPVPVPPNFGLADPNDPKAYNWQQWLIDLKDVPKPKYPEDVGKSLIFRPVVDENNESAYSVRWEIPAQLVTPRNFSITGDGTAPAVAFDGTADVVFNLRNLVAEKWKTPRTITFNGTDSNGTVTLDGSADVSLALVNLQAAKWTTARTLSITGNATGSVSMDGSANVSMNLSVNFATNSTNAVNATNATNANHANTADVATKVVAGSTTVTLTGDVTGTGSADANGNITVATTVDGGGSGGLPSIFLRSYPFTRTSSAFALTVTITAESSAQGVFAYLAWTDTAGNFQQQVPSEIDATGIRFTSVENCKAGQVITNCVVTSISPL